MKDHWPSAPSQCDVAVQLLDMLDGSVALMGVYDQDEVLRYTNEAFRKAYFIDPEETLDWQTLMRRNFEARRGTVIETDDIDEWISSVRSRRGKSRVRTYESDLHDGRFIWVTETMRDDGWIIYVGTDVTPLNASERKLRQMRDDLFRQSCTDELTGISNRRHILSNLEEAIRTGQDAWVCIVDIDHFKKINDRFGHQTGDDVLIAFARKVRKTLRLKDAFGRIGGEEFLILFKGQSQHSVTASLLRLQQSIRDLTCIANQPDLRVTISGGLTPVLAGDTLAQILRRADLGLYVAKDHGRDQLRLVTSMDPAVSPQKLG